MKVKWLTLVCLLAVGLVAVGCAPAKAPTPKAEVPAGYQSLRLVGTSLGSNTATSYIALAALFNKYYPEIEWSSCTGTTGVNPVYLTKGSIRLGNVVPSNYIDAYGFDKIPESRVRSMTHPTSLNQYFFMIPEDSPWKDITDVPKGVALCPGGVGSGGYVCAEAWLELCGLSKKDFNWIPLGKTEMSDYWRGGKLEIMFSNVAGAAPWLFDIQMSRRRIRPMGLSPQQIARANAQQIFQRLGYTAPSKTNLLEVMPEIFKEDVVCPQQPNFLCCRDDFPEEIAYKMVKVIDEHHTDLVQIYPGTKFGATAQFHIKWAAPPLDIHSGVAKYYREKGYLK